MRSKLILLSLLLFLITTACNQESLKKPRPRLYPKVVYPNQTYSFFNEAYCGMFTCQVPEYSKIIKETHFFNDDPKHPCWFDITYEGLNGNLHCSYSSFKTSDQLSELISDAFTITEKHNSKANYRQEQVLRSEEKNLSGLLFEVDGQVASPIQFFLTDSTKHFFRASLYFNSKVNQDSIKPVLQFVKKDIIQMIETFEWTN